MKNSTFLRSLLTLLVMVVWGGAMAQSYEKVTDASQLIIGDKYLIVNEASNRALGTQNKNNRAAVSVTITDNAITNAPEGTAILTLGGEVGDYTFYDSKEGGYLCAASSSSNYLRTQAVLDNNGKATITISEGNAAIKFNGSYTRNQLKYNSSSTLFACYASGQQAVQLYHYVASATPTAAAPTFTPDGGTIEKGSTVSLACGTEGATIYYAINAADPETAVGTVYTTPITINEDCSITAWAEADGMDASARVTKTFETAKKNQTLIFSETNISINEGETLTKPTLSGNETTVTYSSSNTSVATVDKNTGDVTIVGTGTTIITATAEGTNEYSEASAQYTLTVIADPGNGGTVTFDFTNPVSLGLAVPAVGNETSIDNAVISGAVTMTATHGSSTKTRIYNSSGKMDLRIYKNGGSITFAVPDGYEITSITYTGDTKPTNWIGSAQSVTVEATATLKISTATITYARVYYPLNISAAGYATFTSDLNYIIPAGVEGGIVTVEGTTANVNYVYTEGDIVPAGTGLLMKGAQGEYKMYATTEEAKEVYADNLNLLKGALDNNPITAPGNLLYIFANGERGLGFYWQKDSGNGQQVQNMAGKAYLQVPTNSAVKGFRLNLGDTTGITAVETTNGNAPVYTLSGVRVNGSLNNLPAGIYIVGGKKVYVK